MISADAQVRSAYHDELSKRAHQVVLDAMNYNSRRFERMTHPTFKGLPRTGGGSFMRPFGLAKDEVNQPFNPEMSGAGNPGFLTSPKGRQYAKKILNERAQQSMAIQEGIPASAPAGEPPSDLRKKEGELSSLLSAFADYASAGVFSEVSYDALRKAFSIMLGLLPSLDEGDLKDLKQWVEEMGSILEAERDKDVDTRSQKEENFIELQLSAISRWNRLLNDFGEFVNRSFEDKKLAVDSFIKRAKLTGIYKQSWDKEEFLKAVKALAREAGRSEGEALGLAKGKRAGKAEMESALAQVRAELAVPEDVKTEVLDFVKSWRKYDDKKDAKEGSFYLITLGNLDVALGTEGEFEAELGDVIEVEGVRTLRMDKLPAKAKFIELMDKYGFVVKFGQTGDVKLARLAE